jgi:hypothetical protein
MCVPMINTHCQPFNPLCPSIVLCIAVIISPAHILPTCPTAVKIAVRLAISVGLLLVVSIFSLPLQPSTRIHLLPTSQHINCPTIQTRLHEPLQEPHRTQLLIRLARRRAHGEARPHDEREGQPDGGPHFLDYQGVRDVADDEAMMAMLVLGRGRG